MTDKLLAMEELKKQAAYKACALIKDKTQVGLGTGSTAAWVVRRLGERIQEEGLDILAVSTSNRTQELAAECGINLADINDVDHLDIVIDGADEIEEGTLNLIKGHGGALFREKMVASLTSRFVVIADDSKRVEFLGEKMTLPVEVVPFGFERTRDRILRSGAESVTPRMCDNGQPYLTDNGNMILNCHFPKSIKPSEVERKLNDTVGVVEHGLFLNMAVEAFVASPEGVAHMERKGK